LLKARRPVVALVAACLTIGLAAAPSAMAAESGKAKARSAQSAKTVNKRLSSTRKSLNSTRKSLAATRRDVNKAIEDLGKLTQRLGTAEGGVNLLLGAAPQLVSGLQTLGTAVRDQIAPGLQTLAKAVQEQIAPGLQTLAKAVQEQIAPGLKTLADAVQTQIAPNLQRLGDAYQSVEYGAVRLYERPASSSDDDDFVAIGASSANSSDIPDDANGAVVAASIPHFVSEAKDITIRAAIRSNETDGKATGDPAGQVGGILYAKCASIPGQAPTSCAGGAVSAGQMVCAPVGPPAPTDFGGPIGSQPLKVIQEAAPRVGFVNPTIDDTNPTGAQGNECTLPGSGLYEITMAVQFFDFPTSMNPGPRD
jgi:hypothetical protein